MTRKKLDFIRLRQMDFVMRMASCNTAREAERSWRAELDWIGDQMELHLTKRDHHLSNMELRGGIGDFASGAYELRIYQLRTRGA